VSGEYTRLTLLLVVELEPQTLRPNRIHYFIIGKFRRIPEIKAKHKQ